MIFSVKTEKKVWLRNRLEVSLSRLLLRSDDDNTYIIDTDKMSVVYATGIFFVFLCFIQINK